MGRRSGQRSDWQGEPASVPGELEVVEPECEEHPAMKKRAACGQVVGVCLNKYWMVVMPDDIAIAWHTPRVVKNRRRGLFPAVTLSFRWCLASLLTGV